MALGATAGNVRSLVLWQGMRTVAIGLAVGLFTSVAATRLLRGAVAGLEITSQTGAAVPFVAMAALLACYIPARRSTKADPMGALNSETRF